MFCYCINKLLSNLSHPTRRALRLSQHAERGVLLIQYGSQEGYTVDFLHSSLVRPPSEPSAYLFQTSLNVIDDFTQLYFALVSVFCCFSKLFSKTRPVKLGELLQLPMDLSLKELINYSLRIAFEITFYRYGV